MTTSKQPSSTPEASISQQAESDYFAYQGQYRNPFPRNSDEFNAYERYWTRALKMDNARLASKAQSAEESRPRPTNQEVGQKALVNPYAAAKGKRLR